MRFAFLGKGGSGKTTVTASFIRHLLSKDYDVLAIDADVNVHLAEALNVELAGACPFLSESVNDLIEHLIGTRSDLNGRPLLGSTPPARGSRLIQANKNEPVLRRFALQRDGLSLIRVGNYNEADVGDSCYHSKLSSLAVFLHHLVDSDEEFVVADTTAGTDNVATSLAFAYDVNIFVVEPTAKSLSVYQDFMRIAPESIKEHTYVVGNKIEHHDDELFIQKTTGKSYLGALPYSRALKQFEQGNSEKLIEFQAQLEETLSNVFQVASRHKRNWSTYLSRLKAVHKQVASDWANAMYGCDLVSGLDDHFSYEAALSEMTAVALPTPALSSTTGN
ncbi:MAG: hypothetical protein EKK48_29420 [Candidatus Melainabacteria bacterium]|nr:MAG: hypothetical protein EKK48_29420 [Candidatus Melainabacteria bacterium]